MSKAIIKNGTRIIIIESEPDGICELCGKKDELRPYGFNGENICFACGMENKEITKKRLGQILLGDNND